MVNLRFDIFFNAKGATIKEQRAGVRQEKKKPLRSLRLRVSFFGSLGIAGIKNLLNTDSTDF
jgi:hypothetical protein